MRIVSAKSMIFFALLLIFVTAAHVDATAQTSMATMQSAIQSAIQSGEAHYLGALPQQKKMQLSLVLGLRNTAQLKSLLNDLYDPTSAQYHKFLSVDEFAQQFSPSKDEHNKVLQYAQSCGLKVLATPRNRLSVSVEGSVGAIESAFGVKISRYTHPTEKREFYTADKDATLPPSLAITHVVGLNNYRLPQAANLKQDAKLRIAGLSSQGSGPNAQYIPADMRAAYYGDTALDGSGQTIGLVQFGGYSITDVLSNLNGAATATASGNDFALQYTEPGTKKVHGISIKNVLLDGYAVAPSTDDAEEALDIAQCIGMAPGIAQVRVYIGALDTDLLSAIASENVAKQVSISWMWIPDSIAADDAFFEEMAAQGQSVFAASGDWGAYSPYMPYYYPAESQWVTAVGGTHLETVVAGGAWKSESGWSDSGGGKSPDGIKMPAWQTGVKTSSNGASSVYRNVPDISMEADFDNYTCSLGTCSSGYGGTSFAAPRMAAFMAMMNQQSLANGGATLGFLNPQLYLMAKGSSAAAILHDVASGSNEYFSGYSFSAGAGYDLVTGWGSPNGSAFMNSFAPSASVGYTLRATPNVVSMTAGSSVVVTVNVLRISGYSKAISLSVSGLPTGVTAKFDTTSPAKSAQMTLTASSTVLGGNWMPVITGKSGTKSASAGVAIAVDAPTTVLSITSPAPPVVSANAEYYKPGTVLTIYGSIVGQAKNLALSWAAGDAATSGWSSVGVSVNSNLGNNLRNGAVGSWDTSSIKKAGWYTIRLRATVGSSEQSAKTVVYLEPLLTSNKWPQWVDAYSMENYLPVPFTDNNGAGDIAFSLSNLYDSTQESPSIFTELPSGISVAKFHYRESESWQQVVSSDLELQGYDDLIVGDGKQVSVFHLDGSTTSYVPTITAPALLFWEDRPLVEDLDGDSIPEMIAIGLEANSGGDAGTLAGKSYVFAWKQDGTQLGSGFPIQVPDQNALLTDFVLQRILVGDVNGDGMKEILVIAGLEDQNFQAQLYSNTGSQIAWSAPEIAGLPCQIGFADLDHQGKLQTILLSCDGILHVLEPGGTERTGWPQSVGYSFGGFAVGDFNQDGQEEIISSNGNLYVFDSHGKSLSSAFPITAQLSGSAQYYYGSSILADINGDSYPEILTTKYSYVTNGPEGMPKYLTAELQAIDRSGKVVKSVKLPGHGGSYMSTFVNISVGDFNHAGKTQIAVQYGLIPVTDSTHGSMLLLFDTGTKLNAAVNDWPMTTHDRGGSATLLRTTATTTKITATLSTATVGKTIKATVTVGSANKATSVPAGRVNLVEGSKNLASCTLTKGSCVVNFTLLQGSHQLSAYYVGSAIHAKSNSAKLSMTAAVK